MPLVSVILTAHNYGRFLTQSVGSVLGQTLEDWELIIVNDGSTDNTPEILAGYAGDPRISILTLPGAGLAAACNRGISSSHGQLVLRLDADDYLDPHALRIEVDVLSRQQDVGLVYPDFYLVDDTGKYLGYQRVPRIQEGAKLLDANPLAGGAMYRRACYDAIGGYNEVLRYQEDFDFWLRFTERFRAYGIGLPLLSYRQHSNSMSKNRANRSAARRYVKRQRVEARHLFDNETIVIVIPGVWPGAPERPEALLCRELGDGTPIGMAVEAASKVGSSATVVVASDNPGVRGAAKGAGAEVVPAPDWTIDSCKRPDIAWLRGLVRVLTDSRRPVPSLILLASPYCPLRHPERFAEMIDTLLIHDCDLVLSIDTGPFTPWTIGQKGMRPIVSDPCSEGFRFVREAGELLAVRTGWLREPRAVLSDSRIGYVELLYPEWWCLTDETIRGMSQELLSQSDAIRADTATYMRAQT